MSWNYNDSATHDVDIGQLAAEGRIVGINVYVNGVGDWAEPYYAWPNDNVEIRVDVENIGTLDDIEVYFQYPWIAEPQVVTLTLDNGDVGTATGTFTMPDYAAQVTITVGGIVTPDDFAQVLVEIEPTAIPVISGITAPTSVVPGEPVDFNIALTNNGVEGYIGTYYYATDENSVVVATDSAFSPTPISQGGTADQSYQFTMPDTAVTIWVASYFWRDGVPTSGPP